MKTLVKWTIEEYHRLIETGVLGNWEIRNRVSLRSSVSGVGFWSLARREGYIFLQ